MRVPKYISETTYILKHNIYAATPVELGAVR